MAGKAHIESLCEINRVLHKLKDCSAELSEVVRIVAELKSDAHGSSDDIEERSDLLLVAGTVRDMLNVLKTGLEGISAKQQMQVAIQEITSTESCAPEEGSMRSKRSKPSTHVESNNVCDPRTETRVATTAARNGSNLCTHTCIHHPLIVNPGLWSKLGEDLISLVFARLPIPRIIGLRESSKAWIALSDSSSFKAAFVEANPKLVGLFGWDNNFREYRTRILDMTFGKFHCDDLDLPEWCGLMDTWHVSDEGLDSWYAGDGGLFCVLPERVNDDEEADSVVVINPLTNNFKILPDMHLGFREPVLVQLVMDTGCYRVILVYREKLKSQSQDVQSFRAFAYNSKAEKWRTKKSGLVYGTGGTLLDSRRWSNDPLLFDCATKRLFHLDSCPSLQDRKALRFSILKDHLFVLHALSYPNSPGGLTGMFVISEYIWKSSTSDLMKLNDVEVTLSCLDYGSYVSQHDVEIFASPGFILLTSDNLSEDGSVCQRMRIYDISAGQWRDLPPMVGDPGIGN